MSSNVQGVALSALLLYFFSSLEFGAWCWSGGKCARQSRKILRRKHLISSASCPLRQSMQSASVDAIPTISRTQRFSGAGVATLRSHNDGDKVKCSFTHLSSSFPLKLISPTITSRDASLRIARHSDKDCTERRAIAALYVVGYGGGLVSGDTVKIDFDVGEKCTLLLLTQGSTKVFKIRGSKMMMQTLPDAITSQRFRCIVRPNATLVVLPDPVTCFANSQYQQKQHFDLIDSKSSSLILLDWFTPGRQHLAMSKGEIAAKELWAFDMYQSRNDIRLGAEVLARDIAVLAKDSPNTIAEKCGVYTCFATLFLVGTDVEEIVSSIEAEFYLIQQSNKQQNNHRVASTSDPLIWSCSRLGSTQSDRKLDIRECPTGIVVRIAGASTELVRIWLRERLLLVKQLVGDDLYKQALGS